MKGREGGGERGGIGLIGRLIFFRDTRLFFKVTAQKMKKTADLVTFTEEILNGKLHFLCSGCSKIKLPLLKEMSEG